MVAQWFVTARRIRTRLSDILIAFEPMENEKERGIPKPDVLYIGVIDLFAVLVPGVIAAALILETMGTHLENGASNILLFGLLTAGWVLGHVLHGIGSLLDPFVYDPLFKPRESGDTGVPVPQSSRFPGIHKYFHKNDRLHLLATEMTDYPGKRTNKSAGVPGGMYQWARGWLNSHSPESTSNLNRHEADSKLFRSLAVLFLIAIVLLIGSALFPNAMAEIIPITIPGWLKIFADHRRAWTILAFAGVVFSLWRYCDLRNKMIRQCYLNYVQLRFESSDMRRASTATAR